MNANYRFLLLIPFMLLLGCSKDNGDENDPDPVIKITQSDFTTNYTGNEIKVAFSINADWETSISYEGSQNDWLAVTPQSGKKGDNLELVMKVTENSDENNRSANVTIHYGGKTHKLALTQKGRGNDGDDDDDDDDNITAYFDSEFAAKLQEKGYIPNAKKIILSDVKNITSINVKGTYGDRGTLTSLAGIEYFESLTTLDCNYNQLSSLDVSKNLELKHLYCCFNQIPVLDVTKNTALTNLDCRNNNLASLDVSKNTELTTLFCSYNQLSALDVSKNTALSYMECYSNTISTLDVSKNTALTNLNCSDNQLPALDVSKNTALTYLSCRSNKLSGFDVSKNTALTELDCGDNLIPALDVSKNTGLINLSCHNNRLIALDVSGSVELIYLNCSNNLISFLDVSGNLGLKELDCSSNRLSALDMDKNTGLVSFNCQANPGNGVMFVVNSWFDNSSIPTGFTMDSWPFEGGTIMIEYWKAD